MTEEMIPVDRDEPFTFCCSPDVACFNQCCRDLNQFLTPYDILRLKNCLGIASDDLLRRYTSRHTGPESGLPVVTFKPNPDTGHECPFVTKDGCSVYKDRPASCRMYPLARAISKSRQTGTVTEYFAMIQEEHCKGFEGTGQQTVGEWLKEQDVAEYNRMNDELIEIISLKNRIMPGPLTGAQSDQFYLSCYDLDSFRTAVFENGLLADFDIPEAVLDSVKVDDIALLKLGLIWVKNELFGVEMVFD